jgi:hypothetical protein
MANTKNKTYTPKAVEPGGGHVRSAPLWSDQIIYCPKHKASSDMYEALKKLLRVVEGDGKRKHHNLCYGLDVKAHPDCELCKSIVVERMGNKALAKAKGKNNH